MDTPSTIEYLSPKGKTSAHGEKQVWEVNQEEHTYHCKNIMQSQSTGNDEKVYKANEIGYTTTYYYGYQ